MVRSESTKGFGAFGSDIEPGWDRPDEFHKRKATDPLFVPPRPVEAERGTPIVQN